MDFKTLLHNRQRVLSIIGTPTALSAMMVKKMGGEAIYLSGGVLSANQYGLPDLGLNSFDNVLVEVDRITDACDLPLLVDIDTGWGGLLGTQRVVKKLIKSGAKGLHIEDQITQKRCGHRPNKMLVSVTEMCNRIKACVDAKTDSDFMVLARTDSFSKEGLNGAIDRANAYLEAGADGIFIEALHTLDEYQLFTQSVKAPVLANMTEFGETPCFSQKELTEVEISMALYPVTLARMMNQAAGSAINSILNKGSQKSIIDQMQTREQLYEILNYQQYENIIDNIQRETA